MSKYITQDLGELLNLLVHHHAKLNELHVNGNFRNKKYLRHQASVKKIQNAIKAITDKERQA